MDCFRNDENFVNPLFALEELEVQKLVAWVTVELVGD